MTFATQSNYRSKYFFSSSFTLPEFWSTSVHPDGLRYFKLSSPHLKFTYVTEANISEQTTCVSVHQLITELERKAARVDLQSHPEVEVYLEVADLEDDDADPSEARWKYYMVDHESRRIFWLDEFDATDMSLETGGISAGSRDIFSAYTHTHTLFYHAMNHLTTLSA